MNPGLFQPAAAFSFGTPKGALAMHGTFYEAVDSIEELLMTVVAAELRGFLRQGVNERDSNRPQLPR